VLQGTPWQEAVRLRAAGPARCLRSVTSTGRRPRIDYEPCSRHRQPAASQLLAAELTPTIVVATVRRVLRAPRHPLPTPGSESGRAIRQHFQRAVFDVARVLARSVAAVPPPPPPRAAERGEPLNCAQNLREPSRRSRPAPRPAAAHHLQEGWNDANQSSSTTPSLASRLGYLTLTERGAAERPYLGCCESNRPGQLAPWPQSPHPR